MSIRERGFACQLGAGAWVSFESGFQVWLFLELKLAKHTLEWWVAEDDWERFPETPFPRVSS